MFEQNSKNNPTKRIGQPMIQDKESQLQEHLKHAKRSVSTMTLHSRAAVKFVKCEQLKTLLSSKDAIIANTVKLKRRFLAANEEVSAIIKPWHHMLRLYPDKNLYALVVWDNRQIENVIEIDLTDLPLASNFIDSGRSPLAINPEVQQQLASL